MFKKYFLGFSLIILVIAMGFVSAQDSQSDVLGNGTFNEIQTDVNGANPSDTIDVDGYNSGNYEIRVNKSLNFEGKNDAVLDAQSSGNILYIEESSVEIRNITFRNSLNFAIQASNSNITISGCSFEDNPSNAISFSGSNASRLVIDNCIFKNNNEDVLMNGNNLELNNSKFLNSKFRAVSLYGSNARITSCEFSNVKAPYGGSLICMESNRGEALSNLFISECSFKNSYGPVHVFANDVVIEKSKFIENTGSAIILYGLNQKISDCEFIRNTGDVGAAIAYYGDFKSYGEYELKFTGNERFIVKNSLFSDNKASSSGGAIYYSLGYLDDAKNVNKAFTMNVNEGLIDGCVFKNNVAAFYGGAIQYATSYISEYKNGQFTHVTFSNSKFINNRANSGTRGGAIDIWGSGNTVTGCEFDSNQARDGGCIASQGSNFRIDKTVFKNSKASFNGGSIYYKGSSMSISNSHFENLNAGYSGGAVHADITNKGKLTVTGSEFIKCSAKTGGALVCEGKLAVDKCEFRSNSAIESYAAIGSTWGRADITNSKFISNGAPFGIVKVTKDYGFKNNQYTRNSYGMFFIGDEGHYRILNEKFKKVFLIKCSISKSGKTFKIKLTHKYTHKPLKRFRVIIQDVYGSGSAVKDTNSKGIIKYKSKDSKIQVKYDMPWYDYDAYPKVKAKVKAPKVTAKHKKSKIFKLTAKIGKKPLDRVKLNLKIGKKTYVVKTNGKGVAKFNTKRLPVGKHRVKITSADSFYKINAKSSIKIRK